MQGPMKAYLAVNCYVPVIPKHIILDDIILGIDTNLAYICRRQRGGSKRGDLIATIWSEV